MPKTLIIENINEDEFALDIIDGEKVLITLPTMLGAAGSEWEGSPIFSKGYLLALIRRGMENNVLNPADLQHVLGHSAAPQSCSTH